MIKKMTFGNAFRSIPAGLSIEFRPAVNLLVGENGAGKSTILTGLEGVHSEHLFKPANIAVEKDEDTNVRYFDFEKLNPRVASGFGGTGLGDGLEMNMIFASHGQSVLLLLQAMIQKATKPTTFLLDEPDMAMSIRTCRRLENAMRYIAKQGHQVIASVHNPIVILGFAEVFSAEHKRWMKSSEFVDSHMA